MARDTRPPQGPREAERGRFLDIEQKPAAKPAQPRDTRESVAVALRYQPVEANSAPTVVAKGRGAIAEEILRLAFERGVRVRQDSDLAEILSALELDQEIPVETFIAVAEILRYVYAANQISPPEFTGT